MKNLKVMVIGGGGREHALAWKIAASPLVDRVFCAPGNGGTGLEPNVENLPISVEAFQDLADAAEKKEIDLVVVGPDNPLADGIVDFLESKGLKVFGPTREQARLESSKSHAKAVMKSLGIPTASAEVFDDKESALEYARKNARARVVKADGLAYGKGVFVCSEICEVEEALNQCFFEKTFGESGNKVIIEDRLEGEELSIFLLSDGKNLLTLAPSQDHKRRYEKDSGPNTGGMGAYSPVPLYENQKEKINKSIIQPLADALKEGRFSYKGVLFIGILVDNDIPYVLEFNARFGDPEAQTILPRLKSDIVPALIACTEGTLDQISLDWEDSFSLCVVACGDSYPQTSSRDKEIAIGQLSEEAKLFHAGTKKTSDKLLTNGGRVLAVVGTGDSFETASESAYRNIEKVNFEGMDYRKDIGWRVRSKCQSI